MRPLLILAAICVVGSNGKDCEPGQVESGGFFGMFVDCVDCLPGTFQEEDTCVACNVGTVNSAAGQTRCSACTPGYFAGSSGLYRCDECEVGHTSGVGDEACRACSRGTFSNTTAAEVCTECPAGWYSEVTGSVECEECQEEKTSSAGSTNRHDCTELCSAGYTLHNTTCVLCPAGTISAQGDSNCSLCPEGSTSIPGSERCAECGPGSYADVAGSPECTICPPGTITNTTNSTSCAECPSNTHSNTERTECVECLRGMWSTPGSEECVGCGGGYFRNASHCHLCPTNTTSPPGSYLVQQCYSLYKEDAELGALEIYVSNLNYKQIIGLITSGSALLAILLLLLYIGYWRKRRQIFNRSLNHSSRQATSNTSGHEELELSKLQEQPSSAGQYNSCEHVYDTPLNKRRKEKPGTIKEETADWDELAKSVTINPFLMEELPEELPDIIHDPEDTE